MRVHVTNDLSDLAADCRKIVRQMPGDMKDTVRDGIRAGNELAKGYARTKNGGNSASRKYPGTFTAAMSGSFRGASVSVYSGEYGPIARGQGQLAHILEQGQGANAPQNNLAKSTDIIGPSFAQEVRGLADDWFWPES